MILFLLIVGHSFADTALQLGPMGTAKRRKTKIDANIGLAPWWMWMTHHALLHGGVVVIITGNLVYGLIEVISHWIIDFFKCEGMYGVYIDQTLHISIKICYWIILTGGSI